MVTEVKDKKETTQVTKTEPTISEKFTNAVVKEFSGLAGGVELSPMQKRLAQHLFIKIDTSLKAAETKRLENPKESRLPIIWQNINMQRLALDAVHRIDLGLDALIPNHISPIPYWNSHEKKYDLDLRVGYAGKDYYRREMAVEKPANIIYELVYSNDNFKPIKQGKGNETESYEFEITSPFDRGEVVGGFGYIVYADPKKNRLVIVTNKDFQKSENLAKSGTFWRDFPTEMKLKTLVHRVTDKLTLDPVKVNESYAAVESQDNEAEVRVEIEANANTGEIIDVEAKALPAADKNTGEIIEAGKTNGKKIEQRCCVCGATGVRLTPNGAGDLFCDGCGTGKVKSAGDPGF